MSPLACGPSSSAAQTAPLHLPPETPLDHLVEHLVMEMTSVQTRLALTVVVTLLAGVTMFLVAPYAVRASDEFVRSRVSPDDGGLIRTFVPPQAVLRCVQFTTLFAAGLVLLLVWGYLTLAGDIAALFISAVPTALKVAGTVALLGGLVISANLVEQKVRGLSDEADRMGEHEESVLIRVTHLLILVAVGLATLSLWDADISSLLIGAGFLGIVFGMGSRRLLASGLAGFVLMFSRPFEVGDWVEIGETEGTVMDISIMHTHIRSFDGESVVIPNDKVEASTVINRTERGRLRLEVDVGVDYQTDLDHAEDVAVAAVESVEDVLDVPSPEAIGVEFADSAVVLRLRFWIDNPSARRKWRTRAAVIRSVKDTFDDEGIDIPFPQRTLQDRNQHDPPKVSADD